MLLIYTLHEILDCEHRSHHRPDELYHSESNVQIQQWWDTSPGVGVCVLHNLPLGAVPGQHQVDDAGDDQETNADTEVVSGQLVLSSIALQVVHLLQKSTSKL